jgi:hypothetical protein
MAESDTKFEVRIFLVPDPGAFVNQIDTIEVGEIKWAADGEYVEHLDGNDLTG